MKRWNLFMMLVAWVAMSFISCSTDSIEPTDLTPQGVTRTLILSSEKPLMEDEVRTQHNGTTIVWSSDDLIRSTYCHSATGWSEDLAASTKTALTNENSTAAFTVPYEFPAEASAGTYQFYACHPSTQWNGGSKTYSGEGDVSLSLPTEQAMPRAATYDEKGDLLIGASVETPTEAPAEGAVLHFNYKRLVSHACVTLKSLKGATDDEIVSSVTFTAPVALAGKATANFESQSLTSEFDAKSVTVYLPANTKANAAVAVWFCSAPATIAEGETLQVVVETNRATYTRTITARTEGIHFVQNKRSLLSISLGTEDTQKEEKAVSTLTDGRYMVLALNGSKYYAMSSAKNGSKERRDCVEFAYNGTDTEVFTDNALLVWDVAASGDGYTISQEIGGTRNYLSAINDNLAPLITTARVLTVSPNENGSYTIVDAGQPTRRLSLNGSYGFAFYTSTGTGQVLLVPATVKTIPTIAVASTTWAPTADAQNKEFTVTLTDVDAYTATVAEDAQSWLTATQGEKLTLSVTENTDTEQPRVGVVTLSAEGAASVTITVTQAKKSEAGAGDGEGDGTEKVSKNVSYTWSSKVTSINLDDNISLAMVKGASSSTQPAWNSGSSEMRLYGGGTLTITAKNGAKIKSITMNCKLEKAANALTMTSGSFATAPNTTYSNRVWSVSEGVDAVTFTVGGTSGHLKIKSIMVEYEI